MRDFIGDVANRACKVSN